MPPGIPRGTTHGKISNHRGPGCHTDMAVSILSSPPLAPLPPAGLPPAGPVMPEPVAVAGAENRALGILLDDPGAGRPVHVEHIPARDGRQVPWPSWVPTPVTEAFAARGIGAPWCHQALAADHAQAGRNVIISTAAASGK